VWLTDAVVDRQVRIADTLIADVDRDGAVVGVEVLSPSVGFARLNDLLDAFPFAEEDKIALRWLAAMPSYKTRHGTQWIESAGGSPRSGPACSCSRSQRCRRW
jgi:hypothetical protein